MKLFRKMDLSSLRVTYSNCWRWPKYQSFQIENIPKRHTNEYSFIIEMVWWDLSNNHKSTNWNIFNFGDTRIKKSVCLSINKLMSDIHYSSKQYHSCTQHESFFSFLLKENCIHTKRTHHMHMPYHSVRRSILFYNRKLVEVINENYNQNLFHANSHAANIAT